MSAREHKDVSCPFCGLLCDDIALRCAGPRITVLANACARAKRRLEAPLPASRSPAVRGKEVSHAEAIAEALRLLRASASPLFAGLGTDVAGMRALLSLAEHCGAVLDHMHGQALQRNNLVLQDSGWLNTTLSEVRNRADLVLFVGTDASAYPRFHERVLYNRSSQFASQTETRRLVYLGQALRPPQGEGSERHRSEMLDCGQTQLAECLAALRALVVGTEISAPRVAGLPIECLRELVAALMAARYGVVVWSAGDLDFPHAELTVQGVCELVKDVNRRGARCAGFSLGGTDGAGSANSVCAWQSGYPLRVSFSRGYPHYDAYAHGTQALLDDGAVDSLLWVSSFSPDAPMPQTDLPTILLAGPEAAPKRAPEVYLPVGTPGVDHAGHMFRTDGVIALPLRKLRVTPYPAVSELIRQLEQSY